MYDEIKNRVVSLKKNIPTYFSLPKGKEPFLDIPDAHAVSVVSSHYGLPLSSLKIKKYDIHGTDTQVNADPLNRYKTATTQLVSLL
jgi:chromosome partitioning protein